jgi:hypothetical protein
MLNLSYNMGVNFEPSLKTTNSVPRAHFSDAGLLTTVMLVRRILLGTSLTSGDNLLGPV